MTEVVEPQVPTARAWKDEFATAGHQPLPFQSLDDRWQEVHFTVGRGHFEGRDLIVPPALHDLELLPFPIDPAPLERELFRRTQPRPKGELEVRPPSERQSFQESGFLLEIERPDLRRPPALEGDPA